MRGDGELLGELAIAEDLQALDTATDELGSAERRLVHVGAGVEHLEVADVHVRRGDRERVAEAALREAALHRGLTALEVQLVDVALRASLLTLLTTAGSLAETGADAAPHAELLRVGAGGRLELGENVGHWNNAFFAAAAAVSSTETRWRTFLIMPRNDGVFATVTFVPMPRRPRPLTTRRWSQGVPIVLRTCFTRSVVIRHHQSPAWRRRGERSRACPPRGSCHGGSGRPSCHAWRRFRPPSEAAGAP